jgi:nucleoside-diphosphate-sugar epimerase
MELTFLNNKKVAITGATGFIGSRLVETLYNNVDCKISVLIRNYSSLAHLARFNSIDYTFGNIDDKEVIDNFVKNSDFVVHLAYDPSSLQRNLKSIKVLSESCIKYDKRLIHTSTISVYEPLLSEIINEDVKYDGSIFEYGKRKRLIEEEITKYINKGLKTVILQPTIVYGPFSAPWTNRICQQLLSGTVILPDNGEGICNPVYVYDVVRAIVNSLESDKALGQTFLISGPDYVTWEEFFKGFENLIGSDSIDYKDSNEINNTLYNPIKSIRLILGDPKRAFDWEPMKSFLQSIKYSIPGKYRTMIKSIYSSYKKIAPGAIYMPNKQMTALYSSKSVVDISKARKKLGYDPQYSFTVGMKKTAEYVKWAFPKPFDFK